MIDLGLRYIGPAKITAETINQNISENTKAAIAELDKHTKKNSILVAELNENNAKLGLLKSQVSSISKSFDSKVYEIEMLKKQEDELKSNIEKIKKDTHLIIQENIYNNTIKKELLNAVKLEKENIDVLVLQKEKMLEVNKKLEKEIEQNKCKLEDLKELKKQIVEHVSELNKITLELKKTKEELKELQDLERIYLSKKASFENLIDGHKQLVEDISSKKYELENIKAELSKLLESAEIVHGVKIQMDKEIIEMRSEKDKWMLDYNNKKNELASLKSALLSDISAHRDKVINESLKMFVKGEIKNVP